MSVCIHHTKLRYQGRTCNQCVPKEHEKKARGCMAQLTTTLQDIYETDIDGNIKCLIMYQVFTTEEEIEKAKFHLREEKSD